MPYVPTLQSLNSTKLGTAVDYKLTTGILQQFTGTYLINDISGNAFGTTLTSIPHFLNTVTIGLSDSSGWGSSLPNSGNFSCYYYDSNLNNQLDSGEQLGFRYDGSGSGTEVVTIKGFQNGTSGYNYFMFALDEVATKTIYFNFYDMSGNTLNTSMGYVTDTDTSSVACAFPDNEGVYIVQVPYHSGLSRITLTYFASFGMSVGISFVGFVSTPNNVDASSFACFLDGTMILTENGEINISALKSGDKLLNANGEIVTIEHVWVRDVIFVREKTKDLSYPNLLPKDHFSANVPNRDTYISPYHKVMVNSVLVDNRFLGLELKEIDLPFKYYNITLKEGYGTMIANNCVVETYKRKDGLKIEEEYSMKIYA